jgi:hypothetical protein
MSNAWAETQEKAERQAERGGIFIRLKNNGDKVVGAFCGDPYAKEVVWTGQRYEELDPNKPEHKGAKQSLKVSLNFFVPAEGKMKVIEGSAQFFKGIVKVKEKYGIENWLFEIERQGEAGDPKTKYSILPEEKISAELRAQMNKAELHDLASIGAGSEEEPDSAQGKSTSAGPISEQDAQGIVERLKLLPKSDVTAFLAKFGVQRVRDMKSSDVSAAMALLNELDGGAGEEVDPFA